MKSRSLVCKGFKGLRVTGFFVLALLSLQPFIPLSLIPAFPQEPFYKGKTIRIVVGLSAGGGYDRAARLISRYMGKYIPGNPDMIVQNMPGADRKSTRLNSSHSQITYAVSC